MSYNFPSMTDEELEQLLDDGVYDFEVKKSERKTSKNGNPMAKLYLKVWDKDGKEHTVFDYLVFSHVPLNIKKIKHFCDAVGKSRNYKEGSLPEELGGLSGKVQIATKDEQPNDTGGFYPKSNIVVDYIMTDKGAVKYDYNDKKNESTPALDKQRKDFDDVPF